MSWPINPAWCGLAAALTLCGCASTPPATERVAQATQRLAAATVCCQTLAQGKASALPRELELVALDEHAPVFEFGGQRSRFALFALPPYTQPYSVALSTSPQGVLTDATLLMPQATVLDADFKPTRELGRASLRKRGVHLELVVFFAAANAADRYLAVHAAPAGELLEGDYGVVTITPVVVGQGAFHVYSGSEAKARLLTAPEGTVAIAPQGLPQASKP